MYIIEPRRITTMTAVITLDETEVAALIVDPTPLINDLRSLNRAWQQPAPAKRAKPAPAPVSKAKRGRSKMPHAVGGAGKGAKVKPLIHCRFCKAQFINPGSHAKHETNCVDNPDRIIPE